VNILVSLEILRIRTLTLFLVGDRFRIAGFLDFVHRQEFQILQNNVSEIGFFPGKI
jgi:hypothetical protein